MSIRWTRTTAMVAVAALTFVVVFAATLLLRPDPQSVAAVAAPQRPATSTPATSTPATSAADTSTPATSTPATSAPATSTPVEDEHEDHGSDEPPTATGGGNVVPAGQPTAAAKPTASKASQDAAALAAATTFLSDVAGMTPVPGPVARDGDRAEVTFYGRGEDGRVFKGITTVVTLRQRDGSWAPTGARTPTIAVDTPTSGATVSSPLAVAGRAHAYEGTVSLAVVEARTGKYTEVGRGFATGGGDAMRPFSGEVPFVEHNSERGWVVFTEESAVDGSPSRATIVAVEFADDVQPGLQPGEKPVEAAPAPTIDDLRWSPDLPLREEGWLVLPAGPGALTLSVRAAHADHLTLTITPTGTEMADHAQELPMTRGDDGRWSATWRYDGSALAHLGLTAEGPGGQTGVDVVGVATE